MSDRIGHDAGAVTPPTLLPVNRRAGGGTGALSTAFFDADGDDLLLGNFAASHDAKTCQDVSPMVDATPATIPSGVSPLTPFWPSDAKGEALLDCRQQKQAALSVSMATTNDSDDDLPLGAIPTRLSAFQPTNTAAAAPSNRLVAPLVLDEDDTSSSRPLMVYDGSNQHVTSGGGCSSKQMDKTTTLTLARARRRTQTLPPRDDNAVDDWQCNKENSHDKNMAQPSSLTDVVLSRFHQPTTSSATRATNPNGVIDDRHFVANADDYDDDLFIIGSKRKRSEARGRNETQDDEAGDGDADTTGINNTHHHRSHRPERTDDDAATPPAQSEGIRPFRSAMMMDDDDDNDNDNADAHASSKAMGATALATTPTFVTPTASQTNTTNFSHERELLKTPQHQVLPSCFAATTVDVEDADKDDASLDLPQQKESVVKKEAAKNGTTAVAAVTSKPAATTPPARKTTAATKKKAAGEVSPTAQGKKPQPTLMAMFSKAKARQEEEKQQRDEADFKAALEARESVPITQIASIHRTASSSCSSSSVLMGDAISASGGAPTFSVVGGGVAAGGLCSNENSNSTFLTDAEASRRIFVGMATRPTAANTTVTTAAAPPVVAPSAQPPPPHSLLVQSTLDFGQKHIGAMTCPKCGMLYNRCEEDIALHKAFCSKVSKSEKIAAASSASSGSAFNDLISFDKRSFVAAMKQLHGKVLPAPNPFQDAHAAAPSSFPLSSSTIASNARAAANTHSVPPANSSSGSSSNKPLPPVARTGIERKEYEVYLLPPIQTLVALTTSAASASASSTSSLVSGTSSCFKGGGIDWLQKGGPFQIIDQLFPDAHLAVAFTAAASGGGGGGGGGSGAAASTSSKSAASAGGGGKKKGPVFSDALSLTTSSIAPTSAAAASSLSGRVEVAFVAAYTVQKRSHEPMLAVDTDLPPPRKADFYGKPSSMSFHWPKRQLYPLESPTPDKKEKGDVDGDAASSGADKEEAQTALLPADTSATNDTQQTAVPIPYENPQIAFRKAVAEYQQHIRIVERRSNIDINFCYMSRKVMADNARKLPCNFFQQVIKPSPERERRNQAGYLLLDFVLQSIAQHALYGVHLPTNAFAFSTMLPSLSMVYHSTDLANALTAYHDAKARGALMNAANAEAVMRRDRLLKAAAEERGEEKVGEEAVDADALAAASVPVIKASTYSNSRYLRSVPLLFSPDEDSMPYNKLQVTEFYN